MLGGVLLVQRQTHGDTHPEVLRNLKWVTVAALDGVTVVEGNDTDVLEQVIVSGVDFCCQSIEVEEFGQAWVEQTFLNTALHVLSEVFAVQLLQLFWGREVTQYALVDGLEQKTSSNNVECRVIFDVLQCNLDNCFIQLLGGNSVKQRDFELGGNLGHPRNVVVEAMCCLFDRHVDLVGVILLALSVALYDGDSHVCCLFLVNYLLLVLDHYIRGWG